MSADPFPYCQICGRCNHEASDCWYQVDLNYQGRSSLPHNQAYLASSSRLPDENWYVDSDANNHVASDLSSLSIHSPYRGSNHVIAGNGQENDADSHLGQQ